MIKEPTVFILGAGASYPYGYPTGQELRQQICSLFIEDRNNYLSGNKLIDPRIALTLRDAEVLTKTFYNSSTKSIDLFLSRNPEFMLLGKWAITFRLFSAERNSSFRENMARDRRNQDWYSYLFIKLTENLVKTSDYSRFSENNLSIITFNYDRSLEHFLYESIVHSFASVQREYLKEQLNKLGFIHIFGYLSGLEWQDISGKLEYGSNINLINIPRVVENLSIIYEEKENPKLEEAHDLIQNAKRIFFLGFGYAKENLEALKINQLLSDEQNIYGTALGFTSREIQEVQNIFLEAIRSKGISGTARSDIRIENLDCLNLLRKYL